MGTALRERIEELKTYYGKEAPVYDEDRFGGPSGQLYNEAHFSALRQSLRTPWTSPGEGGARVVLEIAAGTGRTSSRLASEGCTVFGLDITPEMLQVAKKKGGVRRGLHFVRGDGFSLPFPPATFDAVCCARMLQMVPREYYGDFGREVERVLRPGGVLVVELWNARYHRLRSFGVTRSNSQGMKDTFVHPSERKGLFGPGLVAEGMWGLGFPLLLRVASRCATKPCMDLYRRLSENKVSRSLGETMLVQYRRT